MSRERKGFVLGVGACTLAVAAFVVTHLRSYPPHEDEVLVLFVGRDSLGGLLETVLTERGGAPLHYLLGWAVVHLGGGLDALRLVSAACAVATVPLIAALAVRLVSPWRALAATALASATWVFLFHAVFGRMYAAFLLAATASFLALLARRWGWWAVATVAALAAHPYGAVLLAAQCAYLLVSRTRAAVRWVAVVLALGIPLWYADLVLAGRYGGGEGPKAAGDFAREAAGDLSSGYLPALALVVALAVVGLTRIRARLLVVCALGSAALALALMQVADASPESRHLIFLLPFAATLVAAGLPRRLVLALPLVAALVAIELAWAWHRTPELFEGESRASVQARAGAAAWLASTARPGDVLHGYNPVFLTAWERGGSFPSTVVPRADAKLALDALGAENLGRGVWVLDGPVSGPALETRSFGPLVIARSREDTVTPERYLALAEQVVAGTDLETVRRARASLYARSSRSTVSR